MHNKNEWQAIYFTKLSHTIQVLIFCFTLYKLGELGNNSWSDLVEIKYIKLAFLKFHLYYKLAILCTN